MQTMVQRSYTAILLACALIVAAPWAVHADFKDPLDTPAVKVTAPGAVPLFDICEAGAHMVAVGARGVIVLSGTEPGHWSQSSVPVQSDLVSIQFVDPQNGWASGHDGVVLHTTDGGLTWFKQLDGISARNQFETFYGPAAANNSNIAVDLQQIKLNFDAGPTLPWLDVWFDNLKTGYIVGSFGDIAVTNDGGKTWQPWLDHIDNSQFLNLNAISRVGGQLYIAGEQGMVYRFDPIKQQFVAEATGYDGSFFGLTGTAKFLLAFGLRGTIFRSADEGKSWSQVNDPLGYTLMKGAVLPNGNVVLVNINGGILESHDSGLSFQQAKYKTNWAISGVIPRGDAEIILVGLGGTKSIKLN